MTVNSMLLLVPFAMLAELSSANFYPRDRTVVQMVNTACPLLYLAIYVYDMAPSHTTMRGQAFSMNMLKWCTLASFLLCGVGDACFAETVLFVPWMMFFGMAHLVRLVGLWLWLRGQRGFDDDLSATKGLLIDASVFLKRQVVSFFLDLYHRRRLFRCAVVSLILAPVVWHMTRSPLVMLHDVVLLILMATLMLWYLMHGHNRAAAWGLLGGLLCVASQASVVITVHRPIIGYVRLAVYYVAQAAFALSAVYARPSPTTN